MVPCVTRAVRAFRSGGSGAQPSAAPAVARAVTGRRTAVLPGGFFALMALFPLDAAGDPQDVGGGLGTYGAIVSTLVAGYFTAWRR